MESPTQNAVEQLNSFLRGEISSVETYRQALPTVKDARLRAQLLECESSHKQRVETLRQRILALGGQPSEGSGVWGAFSKLVQGGASLIGDAAAIQALESGEDHGLADYRRDVDKLDIEVRSFVRAELLPAQEKTHRALSVLKHSLH
jgi:uncharacterized protein (TIGR02284 family)